MYIQKDYFMRMITEMIRATARLVFNRELKRDFSREEEEDVPAEMRKQYEKLLRMIEVGEINEAENILTDGLRADDLNSFRMALMFYGRLNELPEEFLAEHDFSKEEVLDGVRYVIRYFGCGDILSAFPE